jgi:hypothetical protein
VVADNYIDLKIIDKSTGKYLFCSIGIVESTEEVERILCNVSCVLIDGTFRLDDEIISKGVGT